MGHFFWGFSFGQSSRFTLFWVYIWFISVSSHVLPSHIKMDSVKRPLGRVGHHSLFLTCAKEPFCTYVVRNVFDLENEVCSVFYLGKTAADVIPLAIIFTSWSICLQVPPMLNLRPIYLLPQFNFVNNNLLIIIIIGASQAHFSW